MLSTSVRWYIHGPVVNLHSGAPTNPRQWQRARRMSPAAALFSFLAWPTLVPVSGAPSLFLNNACIFSSHLSLISASSSCVLLSQLFRKSRNTLVLQCLCCMFWCCCVLCLFYVFAFACVAFVYVCVCVCVCVCLHLWLLCSGYHLFCTNSGSCSFTLWVLALTPLLLNSWLSFLHSFSLWHWCPCSLNPCGSHSLYSFNLCYQFLYLFSLWFASYVLSSFMYTTLCLYLKCSGPMPRWLLLWLWLFELWL